MNLTKTNYLPNLKPKWENISQIKDLNVLIRQYPNQRVVPQFVKLKQNYPKYRSVRGDGNCFYRAFAFMFLRQSDLSTFDSVFKRITNVCTNSPFDFQQTSFQESLQEIYNNDIKPIAKLNKKERQTELMYKFNNSQLFDTVLILYFRSLNFYYLQNNIQKFREFIHDDFQNILRNICRYDQESQGIQLSSLVECLELRLIIMSADQKEVKTYVYNEKNERKQFTMFLRPGHYDILYDKDSEFINIQKNTYNFSSRQKNKRIIQADFKKQEQKSIQKKRTQSSQSNQNLPQKKGGYTFSNKFQNTPSMRQAKKIQQNKPETKFLQTRQSSNQKLKSSIKDSPQFKNINCASQTPAMSKLVIQVFTLVGMLMGTYYLFASM